MARFGTALLYQFERPFVVDSARYLARYPGSAATSYVDGIGQTVVWYRANRDQIRTSMMPK
ncbi:hypothetical protein [Crossiella sp. CA198]|uniref:hypothetical protein n=1 Tax=Crossiella sp. CA198 TaxID=3455607 RepID=UPI003F8D223B